MSLSVRRRASPVKCGRATPCRSAATFEPCFVPFECGLRRTATDSYTLRRTRKPTVNQTLREESSGESGTYESGFRLTCESGEQGSASFCGVAGGKGLNQGESGLPKHVPNPVSGKRATGGGPDTESFCRQLPEVGAGWFNDHVRICAGGAQQCAFLPQLPGSALARPWLGLGSALARPWLGLGSALARPWLGPGSALGAPNRFRRVSIARSRPWTRRWRY